MALTTNLAAYWKLENVNDSVGSSNLTNNNTVTFTSGKILNAATLTRASSQYLSIADSGAGGTFDITGNLTINCWVNFTTVPTSGQEYGFVTKFDSAGNHRSYQFEQFNNGGTQQLVAAIGNGTNSSTQVMVNWTPSTATWYMVTMVYTAAGGTIDFYVNGASQGTQQSGLPTSIGDGTAPFIIGAGNATPGNFMNGQIDEVGIWSRALTALEVTSLYNGSLGLTYPFTVNSFLSFF